MDVKALKGYFDEHDHNHNGNLDMDGFRQAWRWDRAGWGGMGWDGAGLGGMGRSKTES